MAAMFLKISKKHHRSQIQLRRARRIGNAQYEPANITYHIAGKTLNSRHEQETQKQKMLKRKNEATMLLKTKDNAWVRLPKRTHFRGERTHFSVRTKPISDAAKKRRGLRPNLWPGGWTGDAGSRRALYTRPKAVLRSLGDGGGRAAAAGSFRRM
jgi:hypothetical protein